MSGPRRTLAVTAIAGALALGACGDEPTVRAADGRIAVTLDEYRVVPERIEVRAGRVTLVARNAGRLTHNLAVVPFERPLGSGQERRFARTPTAHPGETVRRTAMLRRGRYRLVCTIANHDNLGQYAELRVR